MDEFLAAMQYWRTIDRALSGNRPRSFQAVFFETPLIEDDRLILTNGPSRAEDSDGYELLYIRRDEAGFRVCRDRKARGVTTRDEGLIMLGRFELAAKYVLAVHVMNTIRRGSVHSLPSLPAEFDKRGLADGWRTLEAGPGEVTKKFVYGPDVESDIFYIGDSRFPCASHFVLMDYAQLNAVGVDGLPLPDELQPR